MQSTTPRFDAAFEKALPREFFNSPPPKPPVAPPPIKPSTSADWRALGIVGILAVTFITVVGIIAPKQPAAIAPVAPTPAPLLAGDTVRLTPIPESQRAPDPVLPLPDVRRAQPAPVPRAELLRVRPIGTVENDRMPDGRLLSTLYKGELATVGDLPRKGNQLGDMWFTRKDGHCWVLAPVTAGSSVVGWVDP